MEGKMKSCLRSLLWFSLKAKSFSLMKNGWEVSDILYIYLYLCNLKWNRVLFFFFPLSSTLLHVCQAILWAFPAVRPLCLHDSRVHLNYMKWHFSFGFYFSAFLFSRWRIKNWLCSNLIGTNQYTSLKVFAPELILK